MPNHVEQLFSDSKDRPFATLRGLTPEIDRYQIHSGKVRDTADLGNGTMLMVATDRISAFDVVLPNLIPGKGIVLTQMSVRWTEVLRAFNHLISPYREDFPEPFKSLDVLDGRAMLVKRMRMFQAECIVRGYITGSGWADYTRTGEVCGIKLPEGLIESQQLPEPIFTPSTKAETGHDENISFARMVEILAEQNPRMGQMYAEELREATVDYYRRADEHANERGIIIADTKFEFGRAAGEIVVRIGDEILTPESSRFWPMAGYQAGRPQPSFDKQYVRDWLSSKGWNRQPPAPELSPEVIEMTRQKYHQAYTSLFPQVA